MDKKDKNHQFNILIQKNLKLYISNREFLKEAGFSLIIVLLNVLSVELRDENLRWMFKMWSILGASLGVLIVSRNVLQEIVYEKENRIMDTLKIMGMNSKQYYKSWFISGYLRGFYVTLLVLVISILFHSYQDVQGSTQNAVILNMLYIIASINQALAFSTVFSQSQSAMEIFVLAGVFGNFVFFFGQWKLINSTHWYYCVFCVLFPQAGLNLGLQAHNLYDTFFTVNGMFTIYRAMLMLFLGSLFYYIMFKYLIKVAPNELGTHLPWNYFIKDFIGKFNGNQKKQSEFIPFESDQNKYENQEEAYSYNKTLKEGKNKDFENDFSSAKFHQYAMDENNQLKQNLTKQFDKSRKAVDNLSLCMYSPEIFCLLGHNGSGKSTTINMITGMIEKTKGSIIINGKDLDFQMEEIRQDLGLCGQKDIYFNGLTDQQVVNYIDQLIEDCDLSKEKHKLAGNLSGGNLRKLNLALALVGNPSILFLDEPTSGMDTHSRRKIWDLLKKIRVEKKTTIVLTTHYLDEAEFLADRIGILLEYNSLEDVFINLENMEIQQNQNFLQKQQQQSLLSSNQLQNSNDSQVFSVQKNCKEEEKMEKLKKEENKDDNRFTFMQTAFMSAFSLFGYCIGTVNYAESLVFEKEKKIKYVLNVQGQKYETDMIIALEGTPFENTYYYGIVFILQSIVCLIICIVWDKIMYSLSTQQKQSQQQQSQEYDQQNNHQVQVVENLNKEDVLIEGKNIEKVYPNGFRALKNLNFQVKQGEILGLLGPNGAGKSTTFGIMTAFLSKNQGEIKIKNQEIKDGMMDIFENIGICPQFDPLWPNLTVNDHLCIFGRIKGLFGKLLENQIEYLLKMIELKQYQHCKSYTLSGGNKRKLSVLIALIGGGDITFFDEPSCGVDPISQRSLWTTLEQNMANRKGGMILTTHSMKEAEFLCSKIGILVNGKFHCIGSKQELQKQFGQGFIVKVKFWEQNLEEIQEVLEQNFDEKQVQEKFHIVDKNIQFQHSENGSFTEQVKNQKQEINLDNQQNLQENQIDVKNSQFCQGQIILKDELFSLAQTFKIFYEDLQKNKLIQEFNIKQNSLEEIFIEVSKLQNPEQIQDK
ncbi:P-loop containing nucleoside triphosphate hydrolase [Pseudocohnilembus persalinus]|uniref:p-loop containing nucleoside triphosphate hydrolase n=1 Tax=Pseudocohnilembus persalinus TaxID=266149 RepID=A0A0V0QWN2_PSEPJ|nr:P-loop containing nucleoside triphosphate hydrolase [Pseudocohnilembus persalinus]|eukprot:KRX06293.1 P-loop containing nucleoside triphosphate hydrolase [Pseudocohnilembus persalinus]